MILEEYEFTLSDANYVVNLDNENFPNLRHHLVIYLNYLPICRDQQLPRYQIHFDLKMARRSTSDHMYWDYDGSLITFGPKLPYICRCKLVIVDPLVLAKEYCTLAETVKNLVAQVDEMRRLLDSPYMPGCIDSFRACIENLEKKDAKE